MADHGGCGINSRSVALRNVAGRSIDPVSASAMAVHPHRERRKPDVFEREAITLVCFFASGKQNSFAIRLGGTSGPVRRIASPVLPMPASLQAARARAERSSGCFFTQP